VLPHNECRVHRQIVQIGCYWGNGGHTELYLLEGDSLAIVDTGVSTTPNDYIEPALAAYGRHLSDIDIILNTHGHHDHAGGNAQVVDASGAQVYVHERDARVVEDPDYQFDHFFAQNDTLVGRADRLDASRAALRESAGKHVRVTHALRDDEVIDLGHGLKLRVVPLPGHTEGSIGYYWEDEGIILIGDSVLGMGSRLGGFPLIYDAMPYEETIARLQALDPRVIGLGHHYRTMSASRDSMHYAPATSSYLQASLDCAHLIRDCLARAIGEMPEAGFLDTARRAVDIVAETRPVVRAEEGLPAAGGTAALYTYWKLMKAPAEH
jgi:glyoxylase-like metal-dependent hydrolase (beta-lactamase superfamily II)